MRVDMNNFSITAGVVAAVLGLFVAINAYRLGEPDRKIVKRYITEQIPVFIQNSENKFGILSKVRAIWCDRIYAYENTENKEEKRAECHVDGVFEKGDARINLILISINNKWNTTRIDFENNKIF